ncbi:MAG: HAD-IIB family hydrolase [Candidatus Pacebacteria bacterium]|nr:HAD-IIB family hydrolase [Candidatus Paceibacterota bacterium]
MTAYSKQLIIFDKDDTLTPSKGVMDSEMAGLLVRLLERKKVAVISGSSFPLFDIQVLHALPHNVPNISNLIILPVSGTQLYTWKGSWVAEYTEHLSLKEKEKIMISINSALKQAHYEAPARIYGDLIEDRGSQITFSALGQNAPLEAKKAWDPDRTKRNAIADFLISRIPEFDIRLGGTTSIDITKRGVNKGYGIRKLEEYLKIPLESMVFVGDALFRGGNDYPAKATGIDCIQVSGPEETKKLIASWLVD